MDEETFLPIKTEKKLMLKPLKQAGTWVLGNDTLLHGALRGLYYGSRVQGHGLFASSFVLRVGFPPSFCERPTSLCLCFALLAALAVAC